jgi:hypothetical protein
LGRGVLFASGAVAGESLMGIGLAGLAAGNVKWDSLLGEDRAKQYASSALSSALTLLAALGGVFGLWWFARPRPSEEGAPRSAPPDSDER